MPTPRPNLDRIPSAASAFADGVRVMARLGLARPGHLAAVGAATARWGPTVATLYAAAALRYPSRAAVVDHRGSITFARLHARSTALAHGLRASGLRPGDRLGLLCRNHRHFVEANLAATKAGLHVVYLNAGFAAPQLAEVLAREGVAGLVCDAEFEPLVDADFGGPVVVADGDVEARASMRDTRRRGRFPISMLVAHPTSPVLLTSGTTGTPKGARRDWPGGMSSALGLYQRLPYRADDVFVIACPLYHAWGLSQLVVAASLGCTVVVVPHFEPVATLEAVQRHRATVLAVVPFMLQRMLANDAVDRFDLSCLRIVASSGSALPATVGLEWMDRVGDTLFNLYGSTEVGQATVASPADLRAAPGTAGTVVPGCTVAILDDEGREVPDGTTGRVFVGGGGQFSGYTGGGTKESVRGLMSSGDVGYRDDRGRLFVTGRSDDMIVSGGENVFPGEVEELLLAHPDVVDVAVVGVPDIDFGDRLAAFVVRRPGAALDGAGVRAFVADRLARHKVPRDVTFVDDLPRTPTGKLLRRALIA